MGFDRHSENEARWASRRLLDVLKKHVAAPTTRAAWEATRAALVGCSAATGRGSKVCKCSCGLMDKAPPS